MIAEKYSSGLISQSFWFVEFKKIIKLIYDGKTDDEIKTICIDENLFGAAKEYRAKRMCGYILDRAKKLDQTMMDLFFSSDLYTQKIINLITILKGDRLFFEFMYEVYREKVILGLPNIEDTDLKVFFSKKEAEHEEIEIWKDTTKKKLRSTYMTYLADANLITIIDKQRTITPPILDITLERYLEACGDTAIIKAITGAN